MNIATFEDWATRKMFEWKRPPFELNEKKLIGYAGFRESSVAIEHVRIAMQQGYAALLFIDDKGIAWTVIWDSKRLAGLLDRFVSAVAAAGWPVRAHAFVLRLMSDDPPMSLMEVVCDAFDEHTNPKRALFSTPDWQQKIRGFLSSTRPMAPERLWPEKIEEADTA